MPLLIGLMSGTSVDGVDAALIRLSKSPKNRYRLKLLDWSVTPYSPSLKKRILQVASKNGGTTEEVCRLNMEIGDVFSKAALGLLKKKRISAKQILAIGSHGQTVCHLGREGTLQIGEASVIAERTGITTVSDFRPADIAAGGLGAPLIPYFHALLFQDARKTRAVHNIGGISNLTFLPKGSNAKGVFGFDTGPGNMLMDGAMAHFTKGRRHFDRRGKVAAQGFVSLILLKELMSHPFISRKAPKAAGREEFGRHFLEKILRRSRALGLRFEDVLATLTAFTAQSIAENYRRFVFPKEVPEEIIFGGGGNHNETLMKMLEAELLGVKISCFDSYGIPADAAEAVCFAVLAYQTLQGRPANLPAVTGAKKQVILGKITAQKSIKGQL